MRDLWCDLLLPIRRLRDLDGWSVDTIHIFTHHFSPESGYSVTRSHSAIAFLLAFLLNTWHSLAIKIIIYVINSGFELLHLLLI